MNMSSTIVASVRDGKASISSSAEEFNKLAITRSGDITNGVTMGCKLFQEPYNYALDPINNSNVITTMLAHYSTIGFSLVEAASLSMFDLDGKFSYVVSNKDSLVGCNVRSNLFVFQSEDAIHIVNEVNSLSELGVGSLSIVPDFHVVEVTNDEIKIYDESMNEIELQMMAYDPKRPIQVLAKKSAELLKKINKT